LSLAKVIFRLRFSKNYVIKLCGGVAACCHNTDATRIWVTQTAVNSVFDLYPALTFDRSWIRNFVVRKICALMYGVLYTDIELSVSAVQPDCN